MADREIVTLDEQELLTFVRRCFDFGNADVFAFGARDSLARPGEIAGYISMMADKDYNPRADSVRLILPPAGGRDTAQMIETVQEGVRRAYRRFEPDDAKTASHVAATIAQLTIDQSANFTFAALDTLLATSVDRQAVIVCEAAHFRKPGVTLANDGPHIPEDTWSLHLHQLMLLAERRARASGSYIILDIGQEFPSRVSNMELLRSAGDVGLCGGSTEDELSPEDVINKVSAAYDTAAAGDVGRALGLIENDDTLSDRRKWVMRLLVLERAGARDQLSEMLDESAEMISSLKAEDLLGIARRAVAIDRDDFAQDLVERALPDLVAAHDLENALQIAIDARRPGLIETVGARLRTLYPDSALLLSVDGRGASRAGDYATAADLLARSPDPRERTIGAVFRLLSDAIPGPGFADPVALGRELAAKMPDWTADMQREIMRSLERGGRRDEAVTMLFSGDIEWTEEWFVFARGLLGRSLASGGGIVGPDIMSKFIDVAAAYIADHPANGFARTSVADLLDADHVGIGGIAVMVMNAVQRAERAPAIEPQREPDRQRLDDMGCLPTIIERVMELLAAKGDGVVMTGVDQVSAAELGENPDAVLTGLLQMVDHHVCDPNDPSDEVMMRNFVAVAIAIAPAADNPDEDLSVIRGAAVKLLFGGRPQVARDLAEQVLVVAGDRPSRRRRALTTFADIYARVGRLREALLALIAAFELASDGTWHEAWSEQSVLLRILRDVGMAEEAIRIIDHLRDALTRVSNAAVYGSRLDTLELHAQLRRHRNGGAQAWTTEKLLDATVANAQAVLAAGDEPMPAAVMLRQLIDQWKSKGGAMPADAVVALDTLTRRLAPPQRVLVAAAGRVPHAALVASIAGPVQSARYNEDVSYDLRLARSMASRLARASVESSDPRGFAYAIELLGTQGVGVHGAGPEVKAADRLLADEAKPLAAAGDIARRGVAVVGMALDESGLMTITVTADGQSIPLAVPTKTFDIEQLGKWSVGHPRGYGDAKLAPEDFRTATEHLGLPSLPARAVVIAGDLSRVPPNVLTIEGDLAGLSRSLATAPSLAWLTASIGANRKGDGSAAAWIPLAAGGSDTDTLRLMTCELEDVLAGAKIKLHTQSAIPAGLASADLAIIGAHGGLAEGNRYFRGISDDLHEPADLRQLVDALRDSRVAILFVCSGGRVDQHPESGGLVGIAHKLLDKGLDAVIAPSWSIPFTMVRPWLRAFLKEWNNGSQIIDAYRAGNNAVAAATSGDLGRSLAMTLYGNPLITR